MPPRRFKKKYVKRIVEKRVAKAIEEYEKTRTDSNNAGGSGSANTGGTVAPEMHGCSYKTFTNDKPHSFTGTEGVSRTETLVRKDGGGGLRFAKCAEDDIVKLLYVHVEGRALTCKSFGLWNLKGDDIEATTIALHELVLMCPELVSTEKKKIEKYTSRISRREIKEMLLLSSLRLCLMQIQHGSRTD
ncbi:hypothetical protein Tco_0989504 [Tanacetum coccineum]|uniref:Uncharacterized protein n=1 Tax=Tanacetum coccineum TaxID=301880 RepID=A0ABQ5EUY5_9ASTR